MRVLVVEDEALVALDLTVQLERAGHEALGPCRTSGQALALLERDEPDAAVLDYKLGRDDTSEPVAAELVRLGVPFVFVTGYSSTVLLAGGAFADRPRLSKPCTVEALMGAIATFKNGDP